jgi:hypothetical protein
MDKLDYSIAPIPVPPPPVRVRIGGREWRWLSRIVELARLPLIHWRVARRSRLWRPQLTRITAELERELPGGRSHPQFADMAIARLSQWFREHPEARP